MAVKCFIVKAQGFNVIGHFTAVIYSHYIVIVSFWTITTVIVVSNSVMITAFLLFALNR
jgi:hypothetical protein